MDKDIIKAQTNLISAGVGVMLFAVWSVVKTTLLYMNGNNSFESMTERGLMDADASPVVYYVVTAVFAAFDLLIRTYISRSAIREGQKSKAKSKYLVISCFLILCSTASILSFLLLFIPVDITSIDAESSIKLENIVYLIVDITSLYILVLLVTSAIRLRKLRRIHQRGGA